MVMGPTSSGWSDAVSGKGISSVGWIAVTPPYTGTRKSRTGTKPAAFTRMI